MSIYRLFQFAKAVFGDEEEANSCLNTPKLALNRKTPLEVAKTEIGCKKVEVKKSNNENHK